MDNTYTSTRVGKVNDFHPLRNSIDKWRGKQMSNNTWTKINNFLDTKCRKSIRPKWI